MKKVIVLILLILLLVVAVGCADEEVSKVSDSGASKETASSDSKKKPQTEFERTDKIKIGNMVMVITETRQYQAGELEKPEEGKVFYLVGITLNNEGDEPEDYNPFNYKMEDANGVQKDSAFVMDVPNELNSGSLAPGGTISGNMVFEVPADMANLKFVIEPNIFSKQQVKIKL